MNKNYDLLTPALLLDAAKLDSNIKRLHEHILSLGGRVRPHGKTAKSIDVVKRILPYEPVGITASTVKEAEYYFKHGISDIIYAVGIAPNKLARLYALISAGAQIKIILDSMEQAQFVAQRAAEWETIFPCLIEFDADGHRAGVNPNGELLIALGQYLEATDGVSLQGVLTHAGGSYASTTIQEIREMASQERNAAVTCARRLEDAGLPCPIVSIGSTPTAMFANDLTGITEVRAGVYMFMDLTMAGLGVCSVDDIAVSVLATVIGHQKEKGWIITDSGWMAMSRDRSTQSQKVDQGLGLVCDVTGRPLHDYTITGASQEHGIMTPRAGNMPDWSQFPIGEQIRILPNHACATVAMFEKYNVLDQHNEIAAAWEIIRGW